MQDKLSMLVALPKKEGMAREENIQIQMKKEQNETISLALYSESLSCILQDKLKDRWRCVLESIICADEAQYGLNEQSRKDRRQSEELTGSQQNITTSSQDVPKTRKTYDECDTVERDHSDIDSADDVHEIESVNPETENWSTRNEKRSDFPERPDSRASDYSSNHEMSDSGVPVESDQQGSNDGCLSADDASQCNRAGRRQREKLRLACKFCLKPFCRGKNPLMNLQKHIMKRCLALHPKQQADDSNTQSSECDDGGQTFLCCYCRKSLSTKYNRDRHVETCRRNPNNKADLSQCTVQLFYCGDCNWPTRTELDLHKHRVQNHGAPKKPRKKAANPKPVACRYCGELFKFTSSRCNHEHFKCPKNLNVTKSFFCRYCGTRCRSQEALDAHTEEKHRDKKCVCKLCGAEFNTRNSKWHHIITTHRENPRRFACTHCSNTYINKRMLLQHMTKHFDERKVQCTICGKCFKNQVQEKSHRKHVHEGRYRYHCGKCGHGVAKRQYLQSHKCGRVRRVQDGEKTIEEHRSEPAEQQQDEQPSLLSAPAVEMNNANMVSAEYGMKPSNEHLVNDMETETLYYSSQPTSTLPSYTQTLSDNRGMIQMPNVVSQAINLNSYMPNCGFLPYPNLNC